MSKLQDRVILITGALGGLGTAFAQRFLADGAIVIGADLPSPRAADWVRELGSRARFAELDVSSAADWQRVLATCPRLDALVNNAAVITPAARCEDTTPAELDRFLAVNLRGPFLGCSLAFPLLKAARGCVLNVSSMSGVTGQARHAAYGATKGGLNALTKCLAVDWGRDGVRVNALAPCGVWTDGLRAWMKEQPNPEGVLEYLNRIHSLHYCPEPAEIAAVAAFLCGPDASFVTGAIMPVSGGSECGYNLEK
jgi:meso-butanediol dehydrogenase / (S,S)-butanediol dehydrogenase / diacetyl reductase